MDLGDHQLGAPVLLPDVLGLLPQHGRDDALAEDAVELDRGPLDLLDPVPLVSFASPRRHRPGEVDDPPLRLRLPVYLDELQGSGPVAGLVTVKIDPARGQLIGLVTDQAAPGTFGGALRTTGRVAVDDTRFHRVNVKFGGFVEGVQAAFVGQPVLRGAPAPGSCPCSSGRSSWWRSMATSSSAC
jgi:hypothetical protein